MAVTLNASTSSGFVQAADTSGELNLQSNGTTQFTVDSTGAYGQLVSGTAVASTSGTSIDFTGIPSWTKRITVMFSAVSGNGTSAFLIQLGDSGGIETTGYTGAAGVMVNAASSSVTNQSTGFGIYNGGNLFNIYGNATICLLNATTNLWSFNFSGANGNTANVIVSGGTKALSATLDQVRITTANGTDAFDAGTINILYEG
jgi:hypothetical protein